MTRRKRLTLLVFLMLTGAALNSFPDLGIVAVSAVPLSPYVMIIPEQTVDHTITPDMNYTVSIYTDYSGSDIRGWQFELFFNPAVLEGLEVRNGDLITAAKNASARFYPGLFNNTAGHLDITIAYFRGVPWPPFTTNGPGTLANVTFRVKRPGISNITLGTTLLEGADDDVSPLPYPIIDQDEPPGASVPPYGSDHIGHGYFDNIPNIHDVAIASIVAPATAILGENVTIDVTAANEGNFTETFDVTLTATLTANTTQIETQPVTDLESGDSRILTFIWSTTGITVGNYTLNATALLTDEDTSDNSRTATIEINAVHDVAIINLQNPLQATIGEPVTINITVANQGSYEENVNLTVYYEPDIPGQPPVPRVINTTSFTLAKLPTSKTISMSWNTTGLVQGRYNINATVTIDQDEDLEDNSQTLFCVLRAPPPGKIEGIVKDTNTDSPIAGATVTAGAYTNTTDADGYFVISGVPAGSYTVTASKDGYENSSSTNVVVVAGQTTTVDFELTPEESSNILLYIIIGVVAIMVVAGVAFFLRSRMRNRE